MVGGVGVPLFVAVSPSRAPNRGPSDAALACRPLSGTRERVAERATGRSCVVTRRRNVTLMLTAGKEGDIPDLGVR